ncbi:MAG: peptidoglycan recognition protein family protein [Planctomycetota bacterium]|jgi:hypothetical protein
MGARLFLLVVVGFLMQGCAVDAKPVDQRSAAIPVGDLVSIPRLATNLKLDYIGERGGLIELAAPPDHVMLVEESRRALVNGKPVAMGHPCLRHGDEYALRVADADRVSSELGAQRVARDQAEQARAKPKPLRIAEPPLPAAWMPAARPRPWRYIVIHHQAAPKGSASLIHRVHLARGMDGLGYHFVVGNGSLTGDGEIEVGFRWTQQIHGAHTRAVQGDDNRWNEYGIGVCLVGDFRNEAPSAAQMAALVRLVRRLSRAFKIPVERVVPHDFVKPTICPGPKFPWAEFVARLR